MSQTNTYRIKNIAILAAFTFVLLNGMVLFSHQVDKFYTKQLEQGEKSYLEGQYGDAIKNLEVAAFGLYNEKKLLAKAYIYLCLCHYDLNDKENVRDRYINNLPLVMGDELEPGVYRFEIYVLDGTTYQMVTASIEFSLLPEI